MTLSRLKQGFDSPRERQRFQALGCCLALVAQRVSNFSPTAECDFAFIQLCMKAHARVEAPLQRIAPTRSSRLFESLLQEYACAIRMNMGEGGP